MDVFDEAAAADVGLDEEQVERLVTGRELAVVHIDVADAAGQLATDGDELVAGDDAAIADDDVFRGRVEAPAVVVAAGLDGDGVVALVEAAVFDEQVAGHFGIDAVVVVAVRPDVDAADDDGFG